MSLRVALVILAIIFPTIASAKEFIVGDESGWTLNFDYQAWAQGKDFKVGDTLVFRYPVGVHNVFKVNGTGFQSCNVPPLSEALTTGHDTIVLATSGRKWYICGIGKHCAIGGMRLFIIVKDHSVAPSVAPSHGPPPAVPYAKPGREFIVGDDKGWTLNFDYQTWARGKDFRVGDKLVFRYPAGAHNVLKVNGTGFQTCVAPPLTEALTSGNDTIVLATPGRKWYICGVGTHCAIGGMRLFITVQEGAMAPRVVPTYSPPPAVPYAHSSREFTVGDGMGWTLNFDYQFWAQGKDFRVGDKLVFRYPAGIHNVLKVNGTGFQTCVAPPTTEALTSGNDTIVLATPGRKWYICGVGNHCAFGGMRLFITVRY